MASTTATITKTKEIKVTEASLEVFGLLPGAGEASGVSWQLDVSVEVDEQEASLTALWSVVDCCKPRLRPLVWSTAIDSEMLADPETVVSRRTLFLIASMKTNLASTCAAISTCSALASS